MAHLDARAKPPIALRAFFKKYQKVTVDELNRIPEILDLAKGLDQFQRMNVEQIDYGVKDIEFEAACQRFLAAHTSYRPTRDRSSEYKITSPAAYSIKSIPGLYVFPSLLPEAVQEELLNRLLHRDLSEPKHTTNVHFHHELCYPPAGNSFFSLHSRTSNTFLPKDPSMHKPFSVESFLNKKLRWLLLGGQYDWTRKEYPKEAPPQFPRDIAELVHSLFPEMTAEAAIVNLYSPGDTLSLHRDVSEECSNALVSISLGCDALFVLGLDDGSGTVIRLHSGDAILMSGASRYAWHGVPCIITDTCPANLAEWPGSTTLSDSDSSSVHEREGFDWAGWMATKRVNLNIRQMWPN